MDFVYYSVARYAIHNTLTWERYAERERLWLPGRPILRSTK